MLTLEANVLLEFVTELLLLLSLYRMPSKSTSVRIWRISLTCVSTAVGVFGKRAHWSATSATTQGRSLSSATSAGEGLQSTVLSTGT